MPLNSFLLINWYCMYLNSFVCCVNSCVVITTGNATVGHSFFGYTILYLHTKLKPFFVCYQFTSVCVIITVSSNSFTLIKKNAHRRFRDWRTTKTTQVTTTNVPKRLVPVSRAVTSLIHVIIRSDSEHRLNWMPCKRVWQAIIHWFQPARHGGRAHFFHYISIA